MTITKKPPRGKAASPKPEPIALPEEFIQAADHPVEPEPVIEEAPVLPTVEAEPDHPKKGKQKDKKKKKKDKGKKKEAVLIRFENGQLDEIDRRAEGLGLSRAAFVRMTVAQALGK